VAPDWARRISPLQWMGAVPRDDWDRTAALGMTTVAVLLALVTVVIYREGTSGQADAAGQA